jgi:class 3 adenylate cyclase
MVWNRDRAIGRIQKLQQSVPTVRTIDLATELYPTFLTEVRAGTRATADIRPALHNISRNQAILVDGVHVYARLANYDEFRLEGGHETERGHKRGLNFLHLHYAASDRIIEDFGAIRIDYHGGRMHCVVADPIGDEYARIAKAIELAQRLIEFAAVADREIANGGYQARLKVGIDTGKCVAINSGSGHEQEPLFLGNAANYAAKLAEGDGDGIYLSSRARHVLGLGTYPSIAEERASAITSDSRLRTSTLAKAQHPELAAIFDGGSVAYARLIREWRSDLTSFREYAGGKSAFVFHEHTPPLRSIDFAKLSPGNSIRMPLVSIFGDVSGYTRFIENAMQTGHVEEAVRAIHVIRGELHNVLKDDFSARKVRYIGDCIHGLLAIGQTNAVDVQKSAIDAVKCAAAMRSSFGVIQELMPNLGTLGLAIGIEAGTTPISRIGRRGEGSVRVASSSTTIISEAEQSEANGNQLAIGPAAYQSLPMHMRNAFRDRKADGLDSDVYDVIFGGAPALETHSEASARAHGGESLEYKHQPARAHSVIK